MTERIEYLGAKEMCVYLLKGKEYMLIEGGMSYIVPTVLRQLKERGIDAHRITKYLILHSHFDHCGAVRPLQRRFPWIQVAASHRTEELYAKEKVLNFIMERNRDMIEAFGMTAVARDMELEVDNLKVDIALGEGDIIDLGDGVITEIIEVPGHSTCSIAAYVPCERAIFASDAGGIPNNENKIFPSGNEDFILYQRSLEKMKKYPAEIHCAARYGAYTDNDGKNFMGRSIRAAEDFRLHVLAMGGQEQDKEKVVAQLTDVHLKEAGTTDVPPEIMKALLSKMVDVIVENHAK